GERCDLALDRSELLLVLGARARLLGLPQRFAGLGLVEILSADRGASEHGNDLRLYLEKAASDEDQLFLAAACRLDAHRARSDPRDERGVARIDADVGRLPRQH